MMAVVFVSLLLIFFSSLLQAPLTCSYECIEIILSVHQNILEDR